MWGESAPLFNGFGIIIIIIIVPVLIGGGILVAVLVVVAALYVRFFPRGRPSHGDMEMELLSPTTPRRSGGEEVTLTHFQTPIPDAAGGEEVGTSGGGGETPSLGRGKRARQPNKLIFNENFQTN